MTSQFASNADAVAKDSQQKIIDYLSGFINEARRERLEKILRQRTRYLLVVLEDIYQSQNASAVTRTCECLGVQEIHVIENRHEYRLNPAVAQGASKWVDFTRYNEINRDNARACIETLKQRGYRIVAMTPAQESKPIEQLDIDEKLALCFGSEEPGLSDTIRKAADESVTIPIYGFTQSYNLSVSVGISLHALVTTLRNSPINWRLDERDALELYIKWLAQSTPTGPSLLQAIKRRQAP